MPRFPFSSFLLTLPELWWSLNNVANSSLAASYTDSVAWLKDFSFPSMHLISIDAATAWFFHYVSVVAALHDVSSSRLADAALISRRCCRQIKSSLASAAVETESWITLNPELTAQILSRFQSQHGGRLWASSPEANTRAC